MQNNNSVKINHRRMQASTAMSRRYTKRPTANQLTNNADAMINIKRSSSIRRFSTPAVRPIPVAPPEDPMTPPLTHPLQETANLRLRKRTASPSQSRAPKITAKQLKDQAIQKALTSAANVQPSEQPSTPASSTSSTKKSKKLKNQIHFGIGRIVLATACAAAAVFAIAYFVNLNAPDISLKVAAMQTGMEPSYPNYIPRDYSISSITAENGKISMEFTNSSSNASFTLIEEKSSWDSNALLSNYIKPEYGDNYNIVREQGLTIYTSGGDAAWVNGGTIYKIKAASSDLTNKQIRSIAASL